jgi:NitT/TauT family transport system substrate-binding protein
MYEARTPAFHARSSATEIVGPTTSLSDLDATARIDMQDGAPESVGRRRVAFALIGLALAGLGVSQRDAFAAGGLPVKLTSGGPGSAETLASALFKALPDLTQGLDIDWVGGDPGQVQTLLLSGAVQSSAYGALGAAEAQLKGNDIVIFGPKISNHGAWLVRGDSPFQHPRDLKGKRIATLPQTSDTYRQARMAAALHGLDLRKDFEVIHGAPIANLALFNRGDVDAIIAIEPTASRIIGNGAREIANVAAQWKEATGDSAPLFLVGNGGRRDWVEANKPTAKRVADAFLAVNGLIRKDPELAARYHKAIGIPDTETAAIKLLPDRLARIFVPTWGDAEFANIDRQLAEAVKLGLLAKKPDRPVYTRV